VRPLRVLTEEVVRSGDRSLRVAGRRRGEIGALADALNDMLDTLAAHDGRLLQEQQQREQQLRSSTLRQRLSNRYIRTRAQAMIDDTATVVVAELKDIAEQGVAVRDSVDRIDDRVRNTGETTQRLVEQARAADVASAAVADSLHRVGRIAKMIGDVAEQTNLLALNASIEAARAGAAGRGFTVVANEVKALARTTAESTQEIADSVAAVETDAMAMAGALLALTGEITRINDEAALLDTVAAGQRAAMAELDVTVTDAIRRIDGMASVTDLIERRQFERVPSAGTVGLRIGRSTVTGDLLDLSAGGLRCITGTGTSVREGAQVLVELPIGPPGEQLRATVVRCRDHPAGRDLGLQFVNLPAQHQLAIDTYINDLFLLRDAEADAA
jgi:methyl-accepting chemotaxis protein